MLSHAFSPIQFCTSILIAIPKNKRKSLHDSNNYRSIALSNVLGKLLDKIILMKHTHKLSSSDLQFGFKPRSSTATCMFVLDEVIKYNNNSKTDVYMMMLDASKAFDRVDHIKLFKILSKKGVCPALLKLLFNMYSQQTMSVRWNKVVSQPFKAGNGVKQGGVLSPILFTLYLDVFMDMLKSSGFSCYIGNVFVGALAYADDIVLLAPSRFALSRLLKQCSLSSKLYQFDFNATKSHNYEIHHDEIYFMNKIIQSQTNCRHLGSTVGSKQSEKRVITATADFNIKTNVLLSTSRNVNSKMKLAIF